MSSENKCRFCLTTEGSLFDKGLIKSRHEDRRMLFFRNIMYIFPGFEFQNISRPFMVCDTCCIKVKRIMKCKQAMYNNRYLVHRPNITDVCKCCIINENKIKLETELVDSLKLYLHGVLNESDYLSIGPNFKLCVKCHNILETFHRVKENIIHANTVFDNMSIADYTGCKLESEIEIKEESIENNELNVEIDDEHGNCEPTPNEQEKKYECKSCSKRFSSRGNLKRHLLTHGGKIFKCETCNDCFTTNRYMKEHLLTCRGSKLECGHCSKRFTKTIRLQKHLITHTAKYVCKFCSKRFAKKGYLQNHLLTHTGERGYQCKHCSKRFAYFYGLRRHLKTHTGEKI